MKKHSLVSGSHDHPDETARVLTAVKGKFEFDTHSHVVEKSGSVFKNRTVSEDLSNGTKLVSLVGRKMATAFDSDCLSVEVTFSSHGAVDNSTDAK